ncbi:MAG: hypothetical protein J7M39_06040 [Anaerolineae bacterium]|nr:hypothetical protein [Anaerolineae bacterium]
MELRTLIFETAGKANTEETLQIAAERATALGIKQVVVASSHGYTARTAHAILAPLGIQVIAVTLCHGFTHLGWPMTPSEQAELTDLDIPVVTGIHALGDGVGAALSKKGGGRAPEEIVRETLYRFSQGMKVAVECLLMAADAGRINMDAEIIEVAGTGEGADTAIVCKPAYPRTFHQLEIREILAKPRKP